MLFATYRFVILAEQKLRIGIRIIVYLSHVVIVVLLHFVSIAFSRFGQNSLVWITVRDGCIILIRIVRKLDGSLTVDTVNRWLRLATSLYMSGGFYTVCGTSDIVWMWIKVTWFQLGLGYWCFSVSADLTGAND